MSTISCFFVCTKKLFTTLLKNGIIQYRKDVHVMYERKPTKTLITKEMIDEKTSLSKSPLPFFTGLCAVLAIVFSAVFGFAYLAGIKDKDVSIFIWILYIAIVSFCYGTLLLFYLRLIVNMLSEKRRRKNGEFLVITDEVYSKEEREKHRRNDVYTKRIGHFSKFGEVEFSDKTWFDMTSRGDTYYIVVHSSAPTDPYLYYPTKLYEYKE